jgi:hypothetical protein
MTTSRRHTANRNNARASTGPKTAAGKARVSRNAWRHGLAARNRFAGAPANEVYVLALRIAGSNASSAVLTAAHRIAEAQIDLVRVRAATRKMLPHGPATSEEFVCVLSDVAKQLRALDRYEERVLRRRNRASEDLDTIRILEAVADNGKDGIKQY